MTEKASEILIITKNPFYGQFFEELIPQLALALPARVTANKETSETAITIEVTGEKEGEMKLVLSHNGTTEEPLKLPSTVQELTRCIRILTEQETHSEKRELSPGCYYDFFTRTLQGARGQVVLSEKLAALLEQLLARVSGWEKEALLKTVWHYAPGVETTTLETHLYRLRKHLRDAGVGISIRMEDGVIRLISGEDSVIR